MTRYKIILFLLLGVVIYSQTPSKALTPNLRLKLYNQGARNIADSINWNWQTIDSWVADSTTNPSANNTWTGLNTFENTTTFNGNIISTGSNTWSGANDFTGTLTADGITLDYYVDVTAPTNSYRVGGTTVLGLTTLGSTVVNSSLESVDTLSAGWISPGFGDINIGLSNFTSDGLVGTSDFISRMTGWRINGSGNADFRYIWADELHVEAFIADISQALAGSDFLTKSVAILSRNFTIPDSGNSALLYVEDLPGFPDTRVFEVGDWVRLRVIDRSVGLIVADVWGTVTGYLDLTNGEQSWSFTTQDAGGSAGLEIYEGSLVLDYGVSGDGFIERTVLDAAGSPYTRVATWTSNPSIPSNYSLKMQYGSLDGITDPDFGALSGFGYYAVDNIYIKGVIKALEGGEIGGYDIYNTKLETTNAILQGGTAPYFKIWKDASTDYIDMHYNSISDWGLIGKVNNGTLFQLGSANKIAGWNFNSSQFSSTNLSGGSDGAFTTSGIALNSSGWLSAPNFALGTVSSKIAGWNFDSEKLYKISDVNSNNKFALNLSATPIIGASQTGFEVYDIDNPKIFVGTKDISGLPSRGFDYNITSPGDFTVRGNFSTRSDIGNDDGIYITDWHIYNRQLSGGLSLESYLNPYQLRFAVDGVEKLRIGDINGLQNYGIKTNGNLTLNIEDMIPYLPFTSSIGSVDKKFLSMYVGEIRADVLVAQEVAANIGGRIVVPTASNLLIRDCHVGDTFIEVKYNNFKNGDIIYFEGLSHTYTPQVEFMRITSAAYLIDGKWRYNVTRNLDNTSENGWWAGDGCISTGIVGDGFIDIYSTRSIKSSSQSGPTIVGNVRTSTAYNGWVEHWAIGNLTNLYGFGDDIYGVGFGKYASGFNNITITDANGIKFRNYNNTLAQWNGDEITLGDIANSNIILNPTGLRLRNGTTDFIVLDNSGNGYFHGNITSDATITGGTISGGSVIAGDVKSSSTMTYARGIAGTEAGYFLGKETTDKFFIGSSANKYFGYDGTDLAYVGGKFETAGSGTKITIDPSDHKIKFHHISSSSIINIAGKYASSGSKYNLDIMESTALRVGDFSYDGINNVMLNGVELGDAGFINVLTSGSNSISISPTLGISIGINNIIDASRNATFNSLDIDGLAEIDGNGNATFEGLKINDEFISSEVTITSGNTIDVSDKRTIYVEYTSATTVTTFTNATLNQEILLINTGVNNVTIQDNVNVGIGGNKVLGSFDTLGLKYIQTSSGDYRWVAISYMNNSPYIPQ